MTDQSEAGLKATGLWMDYGAEMILRDLDIEIQPAKFTAILGPNGCGKSTLLKAFSGLLKPARGQVTLDGKPIASLSSKALAREINILAQGAAPPEGLTLLDLVRQGRYPHRSLLGGWTAMDSAAVENALQLTSTRHLAHRQISELSGGQRQRAWIAMTLAQEGRILLLDEPTTYLDPAHQLEVLGLIRRLVAEKGATVVAVLHDLNQAAQFADHVIFLKDGARVTEGAPDQVICPKVLAEVFGIHVSILNDPQTGTPICIPRLSATAGQPIHSP